MITFNYSFLDIFIFLVLNLYEKNPSFILVFRFLDILIFLDSITALGSISALYRISTLYSICFCCCRWSGSVESPQSFLDPWNIVLNVHVNTRDIFFAASVCDLISITLNLNYLNYCKSLTNSPCNQPGYVPTTSNFTHESKICRIS